VEEKMIDIIHRVGIRAPVADVYRAIASIEGVAGWWTEGDGRVNRRGRRTTSRCCFRNDDVEIGRMELRGRGA
jgi:uncharacterized protein YndB with AHSA1/START domain